MADKRDENDNVKDGALSAGVHGGFFEIRVKGHLDESWSDWFEGLEMVPCGQNRTILSGRVADQAALLGILNKLCRLNLPLVSVNEIDGKKHLRRSRARGR